MNGRSNGLRAYRLLARVVAVTLVLGAVTLTGVGAYRYLTWLRQASDPVAALMARVRAERTAAERWYRLTHPEPDRSGPDATAWNEWNRGLNEAIAIEKLSTYRELNLAGSVSAWVNAVYGPAAYRARTTVFVLQLLGSGLAALAGVRLWRWSQPVLRQIPLFEETT